MRTTPAILRSVALPLSLGVASWFAGCASKEAPSLLVALPSPAISDQSQAPLPAGSPVLMIGRLELPEYWQSRSVRYRSDGVTVSPWPDTYWAERVEVGMSRNFAIDMGQAARGWLVCDSACEPGHQSPAWRLKVVLPSMDYDRAQRRLSATASWTLIPLPSAIRASGVTWRGQHQLEVRASADTPQAQAQAMSELTRALAQHIAQKLPAPPASAVVPRP